MPPFDPEETPDDELGDFEVETTWPVPDDEVGGWTVLPPLTLVPVDGLTDELLEPPEPLELPELPELLESFDSCERPSL
jgi:hypothetical protein